MALLYDAVALGMWAYTRSAFRVATLGVDNLRLEPGTLLVSTHRRETDVPLLAPSLYLHGRLWADRSHRLSFAARDDMFVGGFLAGFPTGLPPRVRKALYPVTFGRPLRELTVFPLASAATVRVGEVLAAQPDLLLAELVGEEVAERFRARACELGRARPVRAGDVLGGEYADLHWLTVSRGSAGGSSLDAVWGRRAAVAAADFRSLVEIVGRGAALLVFPEGRPSRDGAIGPLQRGLGALVRRGEPARLQPIGLAYDPLTRGRTRAFVSFGPAVSPSRGDVEPAVLALLRRATPLTCGQVVADRLEAWPGATPEELDRALDDEVDAARAEARAVDPALLDPHRRRARLADALAVVASRRAALPFLAREYRSARDRAA